jgi:lipopolysaccharide biosynthesis glycosyltransferase
MKETAMSKKTKNLIVFTIDDNYVAPFCVAICSFTQFNNVSDYKIGLLYSELSKKNISKIITYAKELQLEITLHKINDIFKDIPVGYHFNSVIFYRLLIPSIFNNYKYVLYLDADIVFMDTINELFEIQLDENIIAAIPRTFLGVPKYLTKKTRKYFASGLLLFNIDSFNKNNILQKTLDFLKNEYYEMPDQDALNAVITNWKEINLRYGVETAFLDYSKTMNKDLYEASCNPAIIQYSGSSKPWHFRNKHPYKKLYWKYLKMTPFYHYLPEDLTLKNILFHILKTILKKLKLFNFTKNLYLKLK